LIANPVRPTFTVMRRLAAFAALLSLAAGSAEATDQPGWEVDGQPSALDPAASGATATLLSDNKLPNAIGRPDNAILAVRCRGKGGDLLVQWPGYIGSTGVSVRYRVADGPTTEHYWSSSSDGMGTFARGDLEQLVRALATAGDGAKFIIRAEPVGEQPQEAQFTLTGAASALSDMARRCGQI
jgi:hypothetical protein